MDDESAISSPAPIFTPKMANVEILVCLCVSFIFPSCFSQILETYPVQTESEDNIVVEALNGKATSIYCKLDSENGTTSITEWSVNGKMVQFNSTTGQGITPYSYLSIADDLLTQTNLSIFFNFSQYPDTRLQIGCNFSDDESIEDFLVGISGQLRSWPLFVMYLFQFHNYECTRLKFFTDSVLHAFTLYVFVCELVAIFFRYSCPKAC